MITNAEYKSAVKRTLEYFDKTDIILTDTERSSIEIADFGLSNLEKEGLEILTYVNTDRCCAKELVLFPGQACCEHRHPEVNGHAGKEETFRCRYGEVYLYIEGKVTPNIKATIPNNTPGAYSVFHEIVLYPGDQYTLTPNTLHWFQSGPNGAVVSEFSTSSVDEADVFTDRNILRETIID